VPVEAADDELPRRCHGRRRPDALDHEAAEGVQEDGGAGHDQERAEHL
jgi:hypothetical protein